MFPGARAVAFFTILWFEAALVLSHMKTTAHRGGGDFSSCKKSVAAGTAAGYCLSWRTGVETYNMRAWPTVPARCQLHVRDYMTCGQYRQDIKLVTDQIFAYIDTIVPADDGMDAWIFDVDETCLSNLPYYQYSKRFGVDPYDPSAFAKWVQQGTCPAIPEVLAVFNKLIDNGFKVFLVTGRDSTALGRVTADNLRKKGFVGYERLFMRTALYKGMIATSYKSQIRRRLVEEGYRIWGNVGDQWSDLLGDYIGNRTFKIPNPMYFVP